MALYGSLSLRALSLLTRKTLGINFSLHAVRSPATIPSKPPLLRLADQALAGFHPLRPLSPAPVVQAALFCRETSLGQSGVDNGCCDASATAGNDGLRGVDVLGREDFL
jgi:hypothetical protein